MTVAAADPGGGSASMLPAVIGTAALVLIVVSRVRGRRLRPRRQLILPLALIVLGTGAVVPQLLAGVALHGIDYLVIAVDLALSVGLGAARGRTVRIYPKDGTTWYRYGPVTVLLWCLSIVLRFVLGIYGSHYGATSLATSAGVIAMLGLTLLTQNVILLSRDVSRQQFGQVRLVATHGVSSPRDR